MIVLDFPQFGFILAIKRDWRRYLKAKKQSFCSIAQIYMGFYYFLLSSREMFEPSRKKRHTTNWFQGKVANELFPQNQFISRELMIVALILLFVGHQACVTLKFVSSFFSASTQGFFSPFDFQRIITIIAYVFCCGMWT